MQPLAAHLFHRLLHFLGAHIADMRAYRPLVTKWVLQLAVAVAPEHVIDRDRDFGSRADGLSDDPVDIIDVEVKGYR